jgi:hypothetical protein
MAVCKLGAEAELMLEQRPWRYRTWVVGLAQWVYAGSRWPRAGLRCRGRRRGGIAMAVFMLDRVCGVEVAVEQGLACT